MLLTEQSAPHTKSYVLFRTLNLPALDYLIPSLYHQNHSYKKYQTFLGATKIREIIGLYWPICELYCRASEIAKMHKMCFAFQTSMLQIHLNQSTFHVSVTVDEFLYMSKLLIQQDIQDCYVYYDMFHTPLKKDHKISSRQRV